MASQPGDNMSDVFEDYMRCGSCRAYTVGFTDRLGRTMGQCFMHPREAQLAAFRLGCEEYLVDRKRLIPGAKVPDNADLSPAQQARRREIERAHDERRRGTNRRPRTGRSARREPEPEKIRIQEIPLLLGDEEDTMDRDDLKDLLSEVLEEALGITEAPMHRRYEGGKVIVQPGNPELSAKEIPIDALFRKITSVRDKLRVLEQKINTNQDLDLQAKAQLQGYISGAYGSLTTFNFLFRDRDDHFSSK